MIAAGVDELTPVVGTRVACTTLGMPRASWYRRSRGPRHGPPKPRPAPPRALSDPERTAVLAELHADRFADAAPAAVYATLLDEGTYLASERTMYRILAANAEVRERRDQLRHPIYAKPELLATGPRELMSWDITKLRGPVRGTHYHLYVILDVFSRYVPGWMVAGHESAVLAERLIAETADKEGIIPGQLTIHADRGTSMRSKDVALLLADLGIERSHSRPLPRFLDDAAATLLMRASRADPDPLARLIVELLARTGIRRGELLRLTVDAVVQIGSAFWLRIPVGKLHDDRYIPLHPQLKTMLDDWIANHRPRGLRSDRLLLERNRPVTGLRVATALRRLGTEAGTGTVTPHQLRHTLATQAINRGMSLDAIAALLGDKTLAMTMIYARIADKTVAQEYFAVTEKVEALYGRPHRLPADDEGSEMRRLRAEMHRRMLGNGYCARPVELDCHFETICEGCTCFLTTIEFRPTLEKQRADAATKGQIGRQKIFEGLLAGLESSAS